ncbi:MAG: hypothetical protein N4A63_17925 [Vallitalea sp.]|jgi:hypothetical protein|nr:hypothetical protein [Vallitalea sp.]
MNRHKYFFRGVGITLIIVTSIFYYITLNLDKPSTEILSDKEIISRAKELGMVKADELVKEKEVVKVKEELTKEEIITKATELGMVFEKEKDNDNTTLSNEKAEIDKTEIITVKIKYGMSSKDVAKLLYKNHIVDSVESFDKYLVINKYDQKIKTGTYEFKINSTYEEIMNIFTN